MPMSIVSNAITAALLSHPGQVRLHNEDACAGDVEHGAFVVCDGVGGAAGGEIASRVAADTLLECLAGTDGSDATGGERLKQGVERANQAILQQARQTRALRGMGTTLVALLLESAAAPAAADGGKGVNNGRVDMALAAGQSEAGQGQAGIPWGRIWLANIGDSRCYRMRVGVFEQLTEDHSLVEEQVRAGDLTREQAERSPIRNVITRALGSQAQAEADIQSLAAKPGDLYLLATDGLMRELSDDEIAGILRGAGCGGSGRTRRAVDAVHAVDADAIDAMDEARLRRICEALVAAANERGGGDNVTCALVYLKAGSRE